MNDHDHDTLDQADEEILAPTVSDEALEAASGTARGERAVLTIPPSQACHYCQP